MVTGEGLPKGAATPLPVMVAVPVTTNPSLTAGLNVGHALCQSSLSTPSVTLMWCVCAPREVGSSLFTLPCVMP